MNAGALQILNTPSPTAPPRAAGGANSANSAPAGFENFLDKAMGKDSHPQKQNLPQPVASGVRGKPEEHKKSTHAANIDQTSVALPAVSTPPLNSPAASVHTGNSHTTETPAEPSGTVSAAGKASQGPGRGAQVLEALAINKFQTGAMGASQDAGEAPKAPSQSAAAHARVADVLNQISQEMVAKNLPANGASLATQAGKEMADSAKAQPLAKSANRPVRAAGKLLATLVSMMEAPDGCMADDAPSLRAGDQPLQISEPITTQLPVSSGTPEDGSAKQNGAAKNALTAMETLQLNILSRTETANAGPLPNGLKASATLSVHGTGGNNAGVSASALQQKHMATALQNSTRDGGSPKAAAGHNPSGENPPGAAASGSSGDAAKDGKGGQDSNSRHSEVASSQSPGGSNTAASFNAVAASTGAQGSSPFAAANAQTASTSAAQANSGGLPQPAATTHTAVADKMNVIVENPLPPAVGEVNTASLLQRQGKTEMRVAMQSDSLGPLELHAVLDGGRLGASIAVVNHDAHTLLTNNLPSLQQVLNDQNLRVDHLTVLNTSTSAGAHTGNGKGSQSGGHSQPQSHAPRWAFSHPAPPAVGGRVTAPLETLRRRLSVRA